MFVYEPIAFDFESGYNHLIFKYRASLKQRIRRLLSNFKVKIHRHTPRDEGSIVIYIFFNTYYYLHYAHFVNGSSTLQVFEKDSLRQ